MDHLEVPGTIISCSWKIYKTAVLGFPFSQCCADPGCLYRIQDYPGSEFLHPGSRVKKIQDPDSHQRIQVFLTQKLLKIQVFLTQKLFLSSRKNDLGCSSWIRIFSPIRIPDPGVKKARGPGSGSTSLLSLQMHLSQGERIKKVLFYIINAAKKKFVIRETFQIQFKTMQFYYRQLCNLCNA